MPGDFGDESGEKLLDWMLRIGQDLGEDAMFSQVEKLKEAFKHARGLSDSEKAPTQDSEGLVKLRMDEFQGLPEYESIKEIIDERLNQESIGHDFVELDGREYLVFSSNDAQDVSAVFEELENRAGTCLEKAVQQLDSKREDRNNQAKTQDEKGKGDARAVDKEPLEKRAERAKAASKAMDSTKDKTMDLGRQEMRAK